MEQQYDAIVIGSGIGGLSTAAFLSKAYNKKVLVIEKHWTIGGLTHEFERKGPKNEFGKSNIYSWDVGVHYVGAMEKGELPFDLFDYISDGALKWDKVKDPYDIFWYPDIKYNAVSGKEKLMEDLISKFPLETKAIKQYFKDIQKAVNFGRDKFLSISMPNLLAKIAGLLVKQKEKFILQSAQEYVDNRFENEQLKALLLSQWGDYGIAPNQAVFWIHASVAAHYMEGAYYPRGGAKEIAEKIIPVIERSGGKCISSCEVDEIIIKDNKAIGVSYKQLVGKKWINTEVFAEKIISNVGAKNTFRKLLRNPIHPEVTKLKGEATAVTIYMGLKENPSNRYNVTGGNFWMFEDYNHNKIAGNKDLINGKIEMCFLSFPSLKDKSKTSHTAEIVAFTNYEAFNKWASTAWQDRGEAYKEVKDNIAKKFLEYLDTKFEGFSEIVDYVEVSTPLSMEAFTNRQDGAMYGLPCTKERYKMDCLQPKTSIKNLYLSGGDVFMLGVCGALLGGFAAAALAGSKMGIVSLFPKVMSSLNKQRKTTEVQEKETYDGLEIPAFHTSKL